MDNVWNFTYSKSVYVLINKKLTWMRGELPCSLFTPGEETLGDVTDVGDDVITPPERKYRLKENVVEQIIYNNFCRSKIARQSVIRRLRFCKLTSYDTLET